MTEKPFWITSFKSEQAIASRLAAADIGSRSSAAILTRLSTLAAFLDHNGLTTHRLTDADGRVGEDFVLMSSDLTPLGLKLIRKAYVKWQRQAKMPHDVRLLEKALVQMRASESSHCE
jgi:hypothetical protein